MSDLLEPLTDDEALSAARTDLRIANLLDLVRSDLAADTVALLLFDESRQFLVARAARGIEAEVRQGVRIRVGRGFAGRIAAEGLPVALDEVSARTVVNPLLIRHGIRSMLGVPLLEETKGASTVAGVLHVGSLVPRRFSADETERLARFARQVAAAVATHRLAVDRTAAAALVDSLAPRLPEIPGIELAARYVPGSQYGVGGDWYDVFHLPSGLVGITVGDVMGHGLQAATVMGRVRSWLRAYALDHDDPAAVLERIDRTIRHFEPGLIATALYGVFDTRSGDLRLASAGHLRPVLRPTDGPSDFVGLAVDPPIGAVADLTRRTTSLTIAPGALVCMYTDGLVERRTVDIDTQLARLGPILDGQGADTADAACAAVMTAMLDDVDPGDDVTMLVLERRRGQLAS